MTNREVLVSMEIYRSPSVVGLDQILTVVGVCGACSLAGRP